MGQPLVANSQTTPFQRSKCVSAVTHQGIVEYRARLAHPLDRCILDLAGVFEDFLMTQSEFRTRRHGAFGKAAATDDSDAARDNSRHLANLSGRADLTPDEYLILFGDSPDPDVANREAGAPKRQVDAPPTRRIEIPDDEPVHVTAPNPARSRLAGLSAHPYLSATVLLLSILIGAAIARALFG